MLKYLRYSYFQKLLLELSSLEKDIKEYRRKARELEKAVIKDNNPFLAFHLAREISVFHLSTKKLENFVINNASSDLIYRYARDVKNANINKLQNALISKKDTIALAKFAIFVRGSDKRIILDIIKKENNAKAAYLFIKHIKYLNINEIKNIIIHSKKPRYLFELAKKTKSKKELEIIEDLIILSKSDLYVRLFAKHIHGANIEKLENRIIRSNNKTEMIKFAKEIKSPRLNKLLILF